MNIDHPIPSVPATPEYVLEVLRELHRVMGIWGDPSVRLSMETSVKEWRIDCDLEGWKLLGRGMNEFWEIDCPDAAWREVLEPAKEKTLRGVCELIAKNAKRPQIHPATYFGRECAPAEAFLTILAMLRRAGIDVKNVAPSTPLDYYAWRHLKEIAQVVWRLAPGSLPALQVKDRIRDKTVCAFLLAWPMMFAGFCGGLPLLIIVGVSMALIAMAALYLWLPYHKPEHIAFGELRTFRDLAMAVATHSSQTVRSDAVRR